MHSENKYIYSSDESLPREAKLYDVPSDQRWRYSVFFAHGTGFLARTYASFLGALAPKRLRYVPCLGMQGNKTIAGNCKDLLHQTISYIPRHTTPMIGIGHSLGAVLILQAYYLRPSSFSHLVLMDPPLFDWSRQWPIRLMRLVGQEERAIRPAQRAKSRKDFWKTKEEARTHLSSKSLFARFHPQAFEDYINHGLQKSGPGYTLSIPRTLEHRIFCSTPARIAFMHIEVPIYVLYSVEYEVCRRRDIRYIARQLPDARLIPMTGSHMFPLEQPWQTAELIRSLI